MTAVFAWWNTSLVQAARKESAEAFFAFAFGVIRDLLETPDVVALGLCEVSVPEITRISAQLPEGFSCIPLVSELGQATFDLALIVATDRLVQTGAPTFHALKFRNQNWLAGAGIAFELDGQPLYVVLSHWPSRRFKPAADYSRGNYGRALRELVDAVEEEVPTRPVMLMGDYNDDPGDDSMARALMATRDRNRAVKNRLLYNPFWRRLGHSGPAVMKRGRDVSAAGSYYYKGGFESRWHTFDQVLVSSHFLGGRGWRVVEEETAVVAPPALLDALWSKENPFDHLPVIATIGQTP